MKNAEISSEDRDKKVGYIEAAISELENYRNENAALETEAPDRNGILQVIRQAFTTA